MTEIVTFGETMTLITTDNIHDKLKHAQILKKQFGGAESNFAIALSRLGHNVKWISRVGNDPFADEILYHLQGEGVDIGDVIKDSTKQTGIMFKERAIKGDPSVIYYRENSACSYLQKGDIKEETIKAARFLHITGITPALSKSCRETVFHAIEIAKKSDVKVSFDPNLRLKLWEIDEARTVLLELAKLADYFFPGIEEARLLLGEPKYTVKEIMYSFLNLGINQVILKLGEEGCAVATEQEYFHVKGIQVPVVDTVGAGDGFCAGYLSGLLDGLSLKESAYRANVIGGLAVTNISDYGGYPTRVELLNQINRSKLITR